MEQTYLTDRQLAEFERLDLHRLELKGDHWRAAWDAAELAAEVKQDHRHEAYPLVFAVLWSLLTVAEACERQLAKQERTSADDTGETAAARIYRYLDELTNRVLKQSERKLSLPL